VWDVDAQETALARARALSQRDPEAAAALLAQLAFSRARYEAARAEERQRAPLALIEEVDAGDDAYDPLDLYTRLVREFHWTHEYLDGLDYVLVFGYVDRLTAQKRREQDDYDQRLAEARAGRAAGSGQEVVEAEHINWYSWAPTPATYQGETRAYHG